MSSDDRIIGWQQNSRNVGDGPELPFVNLNPSISTTASAKIPSPIKECLLRIVRLCEKTDEAIITGLLRTSIEVHVPSDDGTIGPSTAEGRASYYRALQLKERYNWFNVEYGGQLQTARTKLQTHGPDDMFRYLADTSQLRFWNTEFSWVTEDLADVAQETKGWTRVTGVNIVTIMGWSETAIQLKHQFTLLRELEKRFRNQLPWDANFGIKDRVDSLTSFAKAAGTALKNARNPNYMGLVLATVEDIEGAGSEPSKINGHVFRARNPENQLVSTITENSTVTAFSCIIPLLSSVFQVISFVKSSETTPGRSMDPGFLSALQQFMMSLLALYVTLAPGFRTVTLHDRFGQWTWAFAIFSISSGVSALILYVTVSPAWCSFLSFVAAAGQAFVVLQLILGINMAAVQDSLDEKKQQ